MKVINGEIVIPEKELRETAERVLPLGPVARNILTEIVSKRSLRQRITSFFKPDWIDKVLSEDPKKVLQANEESLRKSFRVIPDS